MEKRNTNYVMAYCMIASGVIYILSVLLPYGTLYESAMVHYRGMQIFKLGEAGIIVGFLMLILGFLLLIGYTLYLRTPEAFYVILRQATPEKAKKVVQTGNVSVSKIKSEYKIIIVAHILLIVLNLLLNPDDEFRGSVYFDGYGPGRYLMFLGAIIGIIGGFLGIKLADMQAADELEFWTAVDEGRVSTSGVLMNTLNQLTSGTKSSHTVKPSEQAKPEADQEYTFCPQCGARCKSGAKFCSSCGEKLED